MKKSKNKNMYNDSGIIVVMILIMLLSGVLFYLAYDAYKWTKMPYVDASLESCGYAKNDDDGNIRYDATYKFNVKGRSYEVKDTASATECEKGATRRVTYNPSSPEDNRVGDQFVLFIVLAVFGVMLFLIPLLIIFECIRDKGKNKKEA